jgi:hypothetical protein
MSREQSARYQQFLWSNPMLVWVGMIVAAVAVKGRGPVASCAWGPPPRARPN